MSREIFDIIGTAAADWSISGDAMRSRPPGAQAHRRDGLGVDLTLGLDDAAFMQSMERCATALAKAQRQYRETLERLDDAFAQTPHPLDSLLGELARDP